MHWKNQTAVTEFLLVGFNRLHTFKTLVFILILTIYIATIMGNVLIIILVSANSCLQSPMYLFLSNLFLSDIVLTTSIIPNMLVVIWKDVGTVSFSECISQFFMYGTSGSADCLLLMIMSYDRYLAICNPLRYSSIMTMKFCLHLILWSWLLSLIISTTPAVMICFLQFCDSNIIDHFFCDLGPVLQISCSDISFVQHEVFIASIPVVSFPPIFIIVSYVYIFITILKISSITGRQKAFSTCSSHLIVVCAYYGTMITLYTVPSSGHSTDINKFLSLLYTVVTPLLNPVIYGLRSQEIRTTLNKCALKFVSVFNLYT